MSLPFLEAMTPAFAQATGADASEGAKGTPRRMLAICNNLGVLPEHFFPADEGLNYKPSHYLTFLQEHRAGFHGHQRRVASERGWRSPFGHQLSHRGAAPGEQFVPQFHFARSACRRAYRRPYAISFNRAGGERQSQPVLDGDGRGNSTGTKRVEDFPTTVPAGDANRDRSENPRDRYRPQHSRHGVAAGAGA